MKKKLWDFGKFAEVFQKKKKNSECPARATNEVHARAILLSVLTVHLNSPTGRAKLQKNKKVRKEWPEEESWQPVCPETREESSYPEAAPTVFEEKKKEEQNRPFPHFGLNHPDASTSLQKNYECERPVPELFIRGLDPISLKYFYYNCRNPSNSKTNLRKRKEHHYGVSLGGPHPDSY